MTTLPTTVATDETEADVLPRHADDSADLSADPAAPLETGSNVSPAAERIVNRVLRRASNHAERRREAEEDRALVEQAQQGDRAAFRKLVERHQRRAFAIALGLVRDENDAREIVQDAFVRVYRNLDRFEGSSAFFTWLYRIITNLAIDHMRRPARREVLDSSPADDDAELSLLANLDSDPLDVVRRKQIAASIQAALAALPPYHRSVIVMREVEGMSYQEMADAMNVSKGTIMSRLFHARQKLQKALADCYTEHLGAHPGAGAMAADDAADEGGEA